MQFMTKRANRQSRLDATVYEEALDDFGANEDDFM